ncbi:hypothetical protein ACRAWD_00980 [Caulobacter segnis]
MRVEGLLVSVSEKPAAWSGGDGWLPKQGVPLVYFDRTPHRTGAFQTVVMDDFGGARDAVLMAISQGRRGIAHLAGYAEILDIGRERRAGYEAGLAVRPGSKPIPTGSSRAAWPS